MLKTALHKERRCARVKDSLAHGAPTASPLRDLQRRVEFPRIPRISFFMGSKQYNKGAFRSVRTAFPLSSALAACAAAVVLQPGAAARPAGADALEFFEKEVRPLLARHCYACHSERAATVFGELRLDSEAALLRGGRSGPAVAPGDPQGSRLIQAVGYASPKLAMPPAGKLAEREIEALTEWVRLGAPWPKSAEAAPPAQADANGGPSAAAKQGAEQAAKQAVEHWAWRPLVEPRVPEVADAAWPRGDIDRFILAELERRGIEPAEPADPYTLLRRLTLDLTGLPPTPAEIREFAAESADSPRAALEAAADRLLASPAFGELWGRHWLDLAGYADTLGLGRRIPSRRAWRYRDYVIDAFNSGKPYDRFLREQIAGDVLEFDSGAQRREQIVATGFLAIGPWALVNADKSQLQMDVIDNQIDTLGRAVLGLTLGCARCHDHKFDPIPQREYYALAGVFQSTKTLDARMSGVFSGVQRVPLPETPAELAARAEELERWQTDYARMLEEQREAERLRDRLRAELKEAGELNEAGGADASRRRKDLQERAAAAAKEAARLKQEAGRMLHYVKPEPPMALALSDRPVPSDAAIRLGGDAHSLGERVPRGFLSLAPLDPRPKIANRRLIGFGFQKSSGRLELAQWLTDPANPLPARVMANRVWHHLFGAGIARSVDNLGLLGERPSHPALLDYLALRLQRQGWSVKGLIREIVLSRTYGLAAAHDPRAAAEDPENRLLRRANRRRLQAETLRDAVLAVSGALDRRRGGPSLPLESAGSVRMGQPPLLAPNPRLGEKARFRRTVYLPALRKSQLAALDILNLFDFPDPNTVKGRREMTTTPTQALYLMNSPFLIEQSKLAARALLAAENAGDEERVRAFVLRALGRPADDGDLERAAAFLRDIEPDLGREAAWARYCHAVLASNEFLFRS